MKNIKKNGYDFRHTQYSPKRHSLHGKKTPQRVSQIKASQMIAPVLLTCRAKRLLLPIRFYKFIFPYFFCPCQVFERKFFYPFPFESSFQTIDKRLIKKYNKHIYGKGAKRCKTPCLCFFSFLRLILRRKSQQGEKI